jgi:2,3-bisphosphoglycerate-independent phosphoglycerate mutase
MVEVLVILDGAAEDPRKGATSLELARTPVLDALCRSGRVSATCTTPPGLPPGSEVGIPTLLGAFLPAAPARGRIEAAAAGIEVPAGWEAYRIDLPRELAGDAGLLRAAARLGLMRLGGHRFLALARTRPALPPPWRVWPDGIDLPRVLDRSTVVVCAPGAVAGIGRLMGAAVVIPPGATGDTDTDYAAKLRAVLDHLGEAQRVVVHIGAPDEASHRRDPEAKVKALEAIDAELLGALRAEVAARAGVLRVGPDHGTDPRTGKHLALPVPWLSWGPAVGFCGPNRLTERALLEVVSR